MIIDNLSNSSIYSNVHPKFSKAFDFLIKRNLEVLADGKVEIDGDDVFALVQSYATKSE